MCFRRALTISRGSPRDEREYRIVELITVVIAVERALRGCVGAGLRGCRRPRHICYATFKMGECAA